MRHLVITGSAGFIGSHLVERLLGEGHRLTGIDNHLTGSRAHTEEALRHPSFRFIEQDVADPWPELDAVDAIYHLASPASPVDYARHPLETLRTGSEGTRRALEAATRHGARLLLASTSEVYGDPEVHPQPESYWGHVSSTGPRSCYDEAKRYAEALTMAYARVHGTQVRIARIFNTYGPRMRARDGRVVSNFINQALAGEPLTVYGEGRQTRSFTYVRDLVEGLVRLMNSDVEGPVNLGNPEELEIGELALRVLARLPGHGGLRREPLPVDDPRQRRPDITRARQLLGWEPSVPLSEGLELTIRHFQALHPALVEA